MKKFIYTTLFLLGSFSAYAQNIDDIEEVEVKGKVLYVDQVNSLKPPVPILDVPQSVSVITDEEIKDQGFREIGDIIRYTPGVNTSQGEGHRDAVVFRGVRSTADFYQDGVRDDVQYYRSLYNVEQLEILKRSKCLALWKRWNRRINQQSSQRKQKSVKLLDLLILVQILLELQI